MRRTLENCSVIKKAMSHLLGIPRFLDGKCEGYQVSCDDDELYEVCKECKLNMYYEEYHMDE